MISMVTYSAHHSRFLNQKKAAHPHEMAAHQREQSSQVADPVLLVNLSTSNMVGQTGLPQAAATIGYPVSSEAISLVLNRGHRPAPKLLWGEAHVMISFTEALISSPLVPRRGNNSKKNLPRENAAIHFQQMRSSAYFFKISLSKTAFKTRRFFDSRWCGDAYKEFSVKSYLIITKACIKFKYFSLVLPTSYMLKLPWESIVHKRLKLYHILFLFFLLCDEFVSQFLTGYCDQV